MNGKLSDVIEPINGQTGGDESRFSQNRGGNGFLYFLIGYSIQDTGRTVSGSGQFRLHAGYEEGRMENSVDIHLTDLYTGIW